MIDVERLFSGAAKRAENLGVVHEFRSRLGTTRRDQLRASSSAAAVIPTMAARMAAQGTRVSERK